jgi:hypothetical protein
VHLLRLLLFPVCGQCLPHLLLHETHVLLLHYLLPPPTINITIF